MPEVSLNIDIVDLIPSTVSGALGKARYLTIDGREATVEEAREVFRGQLTRQPTVTYQGVDEGRLLNLIIEAGE